MFYELFLCDQTHNGCDRASFIFSFISQFTKFLFLIESSFNKEKYIETYTITSRNNFLFTIKKTSTV